MSEESKPTWTNYLAMSTVVFAVLATLSTFKGGGFSTRSVLSQTQASDQWAFYQAKSIKGYLYELQRDQLALDLNVLKDPVDPTVTSDFKQKIQAYDEKTHTYDGEKKEIEAKARELERTRDDALRHSKIFGLAVIFLQLAILLSSMAALLKMKKLWYVGLVLGGLGAVHFANGFLLLF